MSFSKKLKSFYLGFLSKPKCDRAIYRSLAKNKTRSILELGMGDIKRSKTLIEQAQWVSKTSKVKFTAIDLFDSRPHDLPELKLIESHRLLCKTGANIKLMPGDESVLTQIANSLTNTDLVLISGISDIQSQAQLWFYLPRMLHAQSLVFQQTIHDSGERTWKTISRSEIENRAQPEIRKVA